MCYLRGSLPTDRGEATVVTTDALGRQVSTTLPFYVSNKLLAAGLSDFDISTGALRKNYGLQSDDYGSGAFSGIYRYGLTNSLTTSVHGEAGNDLLLSGAGADFTPWLLGTFSFSASMSQSRNQQNGYQYTSAGQELTRNITREYLAGHLPSAPFFDIEALSDHNSPYPHMMPRPEAFAVAMRELGVSSDKHLVVYDDGSLFSAPRAWWMLRHFGVSQVSILAAARVAWLTSAPIFAAIQPARA